MTFLTHLECSLCGKTYDADRLWQTCPDCGRPLLARYDLDAARRLGRELSLIHISEPTRPY